MPEYKHPDLVAVVEGKMFDTMGFSEFKKLWHTIPEYDEEFKAITATHFFTGPRIEESRRLVGENVWSEKNTLYIRIPGGVKGARERLLAIPVIDEVVEQMVDFMTERLPKQYIFPSFYKARNPSSTWEYRAIKYDFTRKGHPIPDYFFRHNIETLVGSLSKDMMDLFLLPFYVQGKTPPMVKGTSLTNYFHNTQLMVDRYKRFIRKVIKNT